MHQIATKVITFSFVHHLRDKPSNFHVAIYAASIIEVCTEIENLRSRETVSFHQDVKGIKFVRLYSCLRCFNCSNGPPLS